MTTSSAAALSAADSYSLGSARAESLLEAARALGPTLRARSAQCRAERKVPACSAPDPDITPGLSARNTTGK